MKLPTMRQMIISYLDMDLCRKGIQIRHRRAFELMVEDLVGRAYGDNNNDMVWSDEYHVMDINDKEVAVRAHLSSDGTVSTLIHDRDGTHVVRDDVEMPDWISMDAKLSKRQAYEGVLMR